MNEIKQFTKQFNKIITNKNYLKNEYFDYSHYANHIWLMKTLTKYYNLDLTQKIVIRQLEIINKIYQLAFFHHKIKQINESQKQKLAILNKELCDNFILFYSMVKTEAELRFIEYQKFMDQAHQNRKNNEWHYSNSLNNRLRKKTLGKEKYKYFKTLVNVTTMTRHIFINSLTQTVDDIIYLDDMLITTKLFLNRLLKIANTNQVIIINKYQKYINNKIEILLFNKLKKETA